MAQLIFRLLTFLLIPFFSLHSLDIPVVTIHPHSANAASMLPDDYMFTYDDVLDLLEELEEGDLERRCTPDQLARIHQFLARLARAGILPDESSEELERDIEKLLTNPHEDRFSFAPVTAYNYIMVPAFCSSYGEIVVCKGWCHRIWDHGKKFVKKHKKAILIGVAVLTVAAVAMYVAPAVIAAAAGAAASSDADKKDSDHSNEGEASSIVVQEALQDNIESFKEIMVEEGIFQEMQDSAALEKASFGEVARAAGSYLAHEVFDDVATMISVIPNGIAEVRDVISEFSPDNPSIFGGHSAASGDPQETWQHLVGHVHRAIDQIFSTDYAHSYTQGAKESVARSREVFGIQWADAVLPPPGFLGQSPGGNSGRIAATVASDVWGWKVGESITNRTVFGTVPKWSTVRRRYWKNRAEWAKSNSSEYTPEQIERMQQGLAPQKFNNKTGGIEHKELHHDPAQRDGGLFDFIEVWPTEHAELDPHRFIGN